jgi:predicted GTPase
MTDTKGDGPAARSLGQVTDAVIALADRALLSLADPARAQLARIRDALREPVRIAVAGRVNAGKSTLVNALVGQVVAPTDVSECTRMVTWYRYGSPQRLEIVMRDGTRRRERLGAGGRLPPEVGGVLAGEVRCLEVWLANETLRTMTLIDTPGLATLTADLHDAASEFLAGGEDPGTELGLAPGEVTGVADAIVFTLNSAARQDEAAALRSFREKAGGGADGGTGNAIGVLSKADKLAPRGDWRGAAEELAKSLAEQLQEDVVTVVPLAGLIAQTAEGAELIEDDAGVLARLAELEPNQLSLLLLSAKRFTGVEPADIPVARRERLLAMLDLQGIAAAIELIREGASGAAALREELSGLSGIAALRAVITEVFRGKGEALKIRSALQAIDQLCRVPGSDPNAAALTALAGHAERLRLGPAGHQLAEADLLALCAALPAELPAGLLAGVRSITAGTTLAQRLGVPPGDAEAARQAALDGTAAWRAAAVGAGPAMARVARIMQRSYALAYQQAGGR